MKDVSIIIVNYNTLDLVSGCIESVFSGTTGVDFEIILIDNGSTDGSREKFSSDARINYVYKCENLGFGRANNLGLGFSCGRNILFLNPDTLVRGNAVGILSDFLDSHPGTGACGGNLFTGDGQPNQSYMTYRPGIRSELDRFFEKKPEVFNRSGKPKSVGFISGADLMVRKSVLDEVGGFDGRFFLFFEETELCNRIERAGYRIMSVPDAEIVHFGGTAAKNAAKDKAFLESRKKYLELTHSPLSRSICNILWGMTVYSRIIFNAFSKERREKWLQRREML